MKDIRAAVRPELFERSTVKSLYYIARHLFFTFGFYCIATHISNIARFTTNVPVMQQLASGVLWSPRPGHEAGHGALSAYSWVNTVVGIVLHTSVLTPYFAWRMTHQTHHKSTNNIERDETYIPPTRQDFQLPDGKVAVRMDYTEILEETPAFTLFKLFIRQFFGFQLYLIHNRKGNPRYPPGTSHYMPSSKLFKPEQRKFIIVSNIAIGSMLVLIAGYIYQKSWSDAWFYYFAPWLHSDPTIPYYRKVLPKSSVKVFMLTQISQDQWTFARGALATVDRPLFGWVGRFFFHNVNNLPQVTEAIKPVLGEYYNYDSTVKDLLSLELT
ncbi:hypothetical protein C0989_009837 [Termitomyces sp. Mn162]|nr:hypothetical protein C0989_009837 [Termitomyces sp. Mn162]